MKTVLIVDDMRTQLDLINSYLQGAGFEVLTASDGTEALAKATEHKPHVIVTDLVMPEMSGLEFCRKLKKNPETADIPIVAWTTKDRDIDKKWAMKQGVSAYLIKSSSKDEIINTVNSVSN